MNFVDLFDLSVGPVWALVPTNLDLHSWALNVQV